MPAKREFNKEIFIEDAKKVYGDKYDYSLIENVEAKNENVPIVCPEHGVFKINYNRFVIEHTECPYCRPKFTKWTNDSVIGKIREIHGDKYDTSKVSYVNNKTKFTLICPEHGEFKIDIEHIKRHQGCPKCRYVKSRESNTRSIEQVIKEARQVHGDKYDYSQITEYKNDKTKYPIVCPEHSVFYQTMNNHIKAKQGCPICGRIKSDKQHRVLFNEFVNKARSVHGNKYVYKEDEYTTSSDYITIICPEHGEFKQTGANHLMGQGCPICGRITTGLKERLSKDEFIKKAREVHGNKYDYTKSDYKTTIDRIVITCPKHGDFIQLPYNHLQGNGCPKCVPLYSHEEETLLKFIKDDLGFTDAISRDRIILKGKELDIYIPSKKIAIEYNGLYWHNELIVSDKNFHLQKTLDCEKQGIRLIHIFEDEWFYKQEIVKSMLKNILNKTENKIYARKCEIKEVSGSEAKFFLENNHIQGNCQSKVKLGLFYDGELVSLMCFGTTRQFIGSTKRHKWELLRFCNKLNTNVVGGASKLFKHFINAYNPESIITYGDRRWSVGTLYNILCFTKYNESKPNYFYVIGRHRYYRFNFRKSILIKKYGCPKEMTEHEFCLSKKWYRIYDCGCLCYEWKK